MDIGWLARYFNWIFSRSLNKRKKGESRDIDFNHTFYAEFIGSISD